MASPFVAGTARPMADRPPFAAAAAAAGALLLLATLALATTAPGARARPLLGAVGPRRPRVSPC